MNLDESLRTGLVEIFSHKMRSSLSLAAIAFGGASVLYTCAMVNQAFKKQQEAFALVGPGPIQINFIEWRKEKDKSLRLSPGLTSRDAAAIRRELPWLHMVSPSNSSYARLQYKGQEGWVTIKGVTPEWSKRNWVYTLRGRYFMSHDYEEGGRVCVLIEPGGWAKGKPSSWKRWDYYTQDVETLATHHDLIGKDIVLSGMPYTVIGILKEPPKDLDPRWFQNGQKPDVIIPLRAAQRYFQNQNWGDQKMDPERIDQIDIDTGSLGTVETVKMRLTDLLKELHRGEEDTTIIDLKQEIQNKVNEMREHAVTIMSLGVIAILAGGVGIMNVTLATIFSRIREIGVRRAVGATRFEILSQFVTEAMLLGVLGGVVGIGLGLGCLLFLAEEGTEKLAALVWWHFLMEMGVSMGTCFVFSLYPAWQAARFDPVEALRYE
ncbi:MAG: ABC transporter permease [Elusimicrobia bacterium]|nr:ABC transporter permease [Elusimicrobiota bacterium]